MYLQYLPLPCNVCYLLSWELQVSMKHSGAPAQLTGVQQQSEACLSKVVSLQMKIMKFVDIANIELLPSDVIFVELEQVGGAGHPLVPVVVPLQRVSVVQQPLQQCGHRGYKY